MSIDVNYYSFSPSRADKKWFNFVEDFLVLREINKDWYKEMAASEELEKKRRDLWLKFKPRVNEVRKQIFDFFDKKGFIIPWVEWDSKKYINKDDKYYCDWDDDRIEDSCDLEDQRKMEYLLNYGCVFSRDIKVEDRGNQYEIFKKNKNTPYLMLDNDAPELKKAYTKIIHEYNEVVEKFTDGVLKEESEGKK